MKTASALGSESASRRRSLTLGIVVTAIWVVTYFAARFVLDKGFAAPQGVKVAAALLPVVPTALFLWVVVSAIRGLDELHRKVHLEALVIAFPLSILMLVTLGFLQLAIELPAENFSFRHVWAFMPMIYFGCLAFAWRRYQ
jgi:hypothetical protein